MAKLSEIHADTTQRVVIYGAPKTGKTQLAGALSQYYKLLWFDLENGHNTLFKLSTEQQDRIDLINIRDSRVYPIAIETMMKVIKGAAVEICDAHSKVACALCKKSGSAVTRVCLDEVGADTVVVIDSLTQLTNSAMAHITKLQPDEYKLQLDDWGNLRVLIDKFLSQIQAARYNVVCITHEEEVTLEDGRKKIVPVSGSSNSSRNTAKYFDHVIYTEVKNKKHVAGSSTDYSMGILSGSRSDVAMEKSIGSASLLDVFTSWKQVPINNQLGARNDLSQEDIARLNSPSNVTDSNPILASSLTGTRVSLIPSTEGKPLPLTPGQIALANLKKMKGT